LGTVPSGNSACRELERAESEAEFDAYLQRSDKIRSIQDDGHAQLAKAEAATGTEKVKIAADVAAKRLNSQPDVKSWEIT
jgi:hypothetical protein